MENSVFYNTVRAYFSDEAWQKLCQRQQSEAVVLYEIYSSFLQRGVYVEAPYYIKQYEENRRRAGNNATTEYEEITIEYIKKENETPPEYINEYELEEMLNNRNNYNANTSYPDFPMPTTMENPTSAIVGTVPISSIEPYPRRNRPIVNYNETPDRADSNANNKTDESESQDNESSESDEVSVEHSSYTAVHSTTNNNPSANISIIPQQKTVVVGSFQQCPYCSMKFMGNENLQGHISRFHSKKSNEKDNVPTKTQQEETLIPRKYYTDLANNLHKTKCSHCDYTSNMKSYVWKHMNEVHCKTKKFSCVFCDYDANKGCRIIDHIIDKHYKIKQYKCTLCSFATSIKSSLNNHYNSVHLNSKKYKCSHCDFAANNGSNLNRHIAVVHLKIKKYNCHDCKFRSGRKRQLFVHISAVHLKIKKYKCKKCKFRTAIKCQLQSHINAVHLKIKNLKCEHCDFSTSRREGIILHMKCIHLKIKNYKCDLCKYRTTFFGNLIRHKDVHLNKKFPCPHCKSIYTAKSNLSKHIKKFHS